MNEGVILQLLESIFKGSAWSSAFSSLSGLQLQLQLQFLFCIECRQNHTSLSCWSVVDLKWHEECPWRRWICDHAYSCCEKAVSRGHDCDHKVIDGSYWVSRLFSVDLFSHFHVMVKSVWFFGFRLVSDTQSSRRCRMWVMSLNIFWECGHIWP